MKLFVGKSRTLWVVSPKSGSVHKVPFSTIGMTVVFVLLVIVSTVSVSLTVDRYAGGLLAFADNLKLRIMNREKEALLERTKSLEATVVSLQHQNEENQKLKSRVESKLEDLAGIIGLVGGDKPSQRDKNHKDAHGGMLHPASWKPSGVSKTGEIATERILTPLQEHQRLKVLSHIIRQIKRMPLYSPVPNDIITSRFGYRDSPFGEGSRFHSGIDFGLRFTTTVRAAGNGIVRSVGFNSGYGNVIDLEHSRNVVTRYAHLSEVKVKVGQRVRAGDVIAIGGSTGRATATHLHYEIRVRGQARDPELFLSLPRKIEMVLKASSLTHKG